MTWLTILKSFSITHLFNNFLVLNVTTNMHFLTQFLVLYNQKFFVRSVLIKRLSLQLLLASVF